MLNPSRLLYVCVVLTTSVMITAAERRNTLRFQEEKKLKLKVKDYPFRNTSLSWDKRVDDLVSRLTLEEIQDQMSHGGAGNYGGPAPAIPRLGIGPYRWDTECLRGAVQEDGMATGFPQAIGLAATFDLELMSRLAVAIGEEVRGKHNDFVKRKIFHDHTGASCFSPVINIARDPRWGRNQETYGEDPFLSGVLAEVYVKSLQGNDSRYIRASAGCKHFDVHGGPDNIPVDRDSFNAVVNKADWRMTFLPAFKRCVDAGTYSLMCSYNRINGVPACANSDLLTGILRNEWKFKGYVVSDEGAIENIITKHHYLNNSVDTVAACVKAGCNLELSGNLKNPVYSSLANAVNSKKLTMKQVQDSVKPLFYTRMRLGEFDPPQKNPYSRLNSGVVESPEHKALAVEAAMKSFVLLKNDKRLLPLKGGAHKRVSLIGPMADNYAMLAGDYSVVQPRSYTKTPLEALKQVYENITYKPACLDKTPCKDYSSSVVEKVVSGSDLVFIALGTGIAVETEGRDRPDLELPGYQKNLVLDVIKYADKSADIVLLLFNAGPLNISFAHFNDDVGAILECFFPAQATGDALVRILFNKGKNSSPAGRVPMTWPLYESQIPDMVNYSMAERTYRYMQSKPLYAFGFGYSYGKIIYTQLSHWESVKPRENQKGSVTLTNIGNVDTDEVIQCYVTRDDAEWPKARSQLGFFTRRHIAVNSEIQVDFSIPWQTWAYWQAGDWQVDEGSYYLSCGGGQNGMTAPTTGSIEDLFVITTEDRARMIKTKNQ